MSVQRARRFLTSGAIGVVLTSGLTWWLWTAVGVPQALALAVFSFLAGAAYGYWIMGGPLHPDARRSDVEQASVSRARAKLRPQRDWAGFAFYLAILLALLLVAVVIGIMQAS